MNETTLTLTQTAIYITAALSWVGLVVIGRSLYKGIFK